MIQPTLKRTSPQSKPTRSKLWLFFFLGGTVLGTCFGLYLWSLYAQLAATFQETKQFSPSRLYSDVTQISLGQPKQEIEEHLKNRGYHITSSVSPTSKSTHLQFDLHPIQYPTYLLPDRHPMLNAQQWNVDLEFPTTQALAPLQQILLGGSPIADLYLEPEWIGTLSSNTNHPNELRTPLRFDAIPAPIWKAIIAIEDQHFLDHRGFDPRGLIRAIWVDLKTLSFAQGGSTITQQLVKNLLARHNKNLFRKINELFLSLLLEVRFEKEKILERYLNEVYLGQVGGFEVHGVAEGAEHFFGKTIEELTLGESALMAGLIRGPGYYSPYRFKTRALERQKLVLKKMVETEQIAEEEATAALTQPIHLASPQTASLKAPFFADYAKAEILQLLKKEFTEEEIIQAGFRIYTTLDSRLNTIAQQAVTQGTQNLEQQFKLPPTQSIEGALASVDQTTGWIRALIGGKNYTKSNFNRILNMKRQVGSTFKPLVYLTAFQQGEDAKGVPFGPAYPVEDSPWSLTFDRGKQNWAPKNYERNFLGWTSLKKALNHSINTITARLAYEIGIPNIIETAKSLGIESSLPSVPSLALGVAELSPLELLQVYATFANHGVLQKLTVIRAITQADGKDYLRPMHPPKVVAAPGPIDLLSYLLETVFTEGTAKSAARLGWTFPAAGKTGTTNNHIDAWFAGYTPQLTTVVWVGMDQPSTLDPKQKVFLTGAQSALPIWVHYMKRSPAGRIPVLFPPSPHLTEVVMDLYTGQLAQSDCHSTFTIREKMMSNHLPHQSTCETHWPTELPQEVTGP